MTEYEVTWTVAVDAEDAWDAAERALAMQRNPESIAVVFTCQAAGLKPVEIDLYEETVDGVKG